MFNMEFVNRPFYQNIQIDWCFFPGDLGTRYSINLAVIEWITILGIQFAYITCCYVGLASGKLLGCQEQPFFKQYAYNFDVS